jgi:glucan biosynthesis protein C
MLEVGRSRSPRDPASAPRLDYLDATRAFALVLGVVFHASLSFSPFFMGWAVQDVSTGAFVADFFLVSHSFRMELFFLLAGFFSHGLYHRQEPGAFLRARLLRLGVPFVAGWFLLRPLVVSGWIMGAASLRGDYDFWASLGAGFASLRSLPAGLFTGTHLWFLYYLLLATALLLVIRWVALRAARTLAGETGLDRLGAGVDAVARWLAVSAWGLPVLAGLTATALWRMRFWNMDTPDQSLAPHLPVLAVYGGCFALGWAFARRPETLTEFSRLTVDRVVALALSIAAVRQLRPIRDIPTSPRRMSASWRPTRP